MRNIRKYAVGLAATMALSVALVTPAVAATGTLQAPVHTAVAATIRPDTNIPLCGDHFQLTRHGSVVRIVGVDLGAFGSGAMLVFVDWSGGYEEYGASSNGGASFEINTGSSSRTDISISLTNEENTATLCASTYNA